MTNNTLAVITELQPIARRMRERQEQINRDKNDVYGKIANLISTAQDQGLDCLTAKAKLGKVIKWSEWLNAHVPTLSESDAGKYERLTNEQLSDPRQCMFAFLPASDKSSEPKESRTPPNERELLWGRISKLNHTLKAIDISSWPKPDIELTKSELEPVAKKLWPDKFEGPSGASGQRG